MAMVDRRSRDRLDVRAIDGASIAVWVEGAGPPLVMVHGSIADHTTFEALIAELRHDVTTFAVDRRGFGATGDVSDYRIERDFEDVAAVVDAVASIEGPVALWGHSYGANCAMGGAALAAGVHHLVLYEPSLGLTYPPGVIERIEAAIERGDDDAAITTTLIELVGMTPDEVAGYRASPRWPDRLAAAVTIPRECHAEEGWAYRAGHFDSITAPTLFVTGSDSPPELIDTTHHAAAAVGNGRVLVLDGQGHMAHHTDPAMVANLVLEFINS